MKSKMLGNVFALMLTALGLSSCEKMALTDSASSKDSAKANVVLRVSNFEQIPFGSLTRADVSSLCTRLNFAVYDEDGNRVKQINQKYGDSDFGKASMTLAEGSYHLVALAHSSSGNPTMTDMLKIKFTNTIGYTDTFLYYGELVVGEEQQEQSLTLHRITSLFRFVIEDDIPANIKQLRFYYTGGSGTFDGTTGYGNVNSKQTVFFDIDGTQKQFDVYTILKDETASLTVLVSAYDDKDNTIKEREFTEVPMQRNMITRYSGDFFAGSSGETRSNSFSVDVDDTWLGENRYSY